MPAFDPHALERLAGLHAQAWQGLFSSTATIAVLPLRTLQHLTGWPDHAPQTPLERLAEAESRVAALGAALAAEQSARQADAARWRARLDAQHALVEALRAEHAQTEREAANTLASARQDQARTLYRTLEPLLTQLPLVRHAVAQGQEVAAHDLLALLGPLDAAIVALGLAPIGAVGETPPFDPQLHQMARGAAPDPGETVTVKHVGFRLGDEILRRARVSRPDAS